MSYISSEVKRLRGKGITFRTGFVNQYGKKIFDEKQVMNCLKDQKWHINLDQYIKFWKVILQFLEKAQVKQINIVEINNKIILKQLKNISFQDISILNLEKNLIESIQPLQFISLQRLKLLNLNFNCLTLSKCLRKKKTQIQELHIAGNLISDIHCLKRMKLKNLTKLTIESISQGKTNGESLAWVMCVDSRNLQEITAKSRSRIKQPHLEFVLGRKYKKIEIDTDY